MPFSEIKKISSREPKHGVSERQVMFFLQGEADAQESKTKVNMAPIRQSFQTGTNKKDPESHWRSTILAKRSHVFRSHRSW